MIIFRLEVLKTQVLVVNAAFIEKPDVIFMVTITWLCIFQWPFWQEVIDAETALKLDGLKTKVLELHGLLRRKSAEADGQEELLKRAKEGSIGSKSASEELSSELQKITLDVLSKRCKALEVRELSLPKKWDPTKKIGWEDPPKQETRRMSCVLFFFSSFCLIGALQRSYLET